MLEGQGEILYLLPDLLLPAVEAGDQILEEFLPQQRHIVLKLLLKLLHIQLLLALLCQLRHRLTEDTADLGQLDRLQNISLCIDLQRLPGVGEVLGAADNNNPGGAACFPQLLCYLKSPISGIIMSVNRMSGRSFRHNS